MSNGLRISESEFAVCKNKLINYKEFLYDCVDDYNNYLEKVMECGIKDEKITANLLELQQKMKALQTVIDSNTNEVGVTMKNYLSDVSAKDKFVYSDQNMNSIISLLSIFL